MCGGGLIQPISSPYRVLFKSPLLLTASLYFDFCLLFFFTNCMALFKSSQGTNHVATHRELAKGLSKRLNILFSVTGKNITAMII